MPTHRVRPRVRVRDLSPEPERTSKRKSAVTHEQNPQPDFRLAIDFGTKYTSIACSRRQGKPFTIQEFPDDPQPGKMHMQVPTEILYLSTRIREHSKENAPTRTVYGYEIQERKNRPDSDEEDSVEMGHVTNAKLLLDKSVHLSSLRRTLIDKLKQLKINKSIAKPEDVVRDLLVCYFQHTKTILQRDHGLRDNHTVEITFCVPVCWNPSANETMSSCLQEALTKVKFCAGNRDTYNLFMVNEAEAAAMYTLTSNFHAYDWGDVFMLLDCGGGTTDAGVYAIGHEYPFRLGKQLTTTSGAVCGSGDLNRAFYDFAMRHLQEAKCLLVGKVSIAEIIETDIMPIFESTAKRSFSLRHKQDKNKIYPFRIRELQAEEGNSRIFKDTFVLSYDDMEALFMPSLKKISNLMRNQIHEIVRIQSQINKVVLAGGFSDSPALKEYLADTLEEINHKNKTDIKLVSAPQNSGAAGVALGALLRAEDKNHGPAKVPCQSIGILHHVRNEPERYTEEVLHQHEDEWDICDKDGEYYIMNTIKWIIKKGEGEFKSVHEAEWEDLHIFTLAHKKVWLAEYELFASEECTQDFFKRSHPKNRGKTHKIGKVVFDLVPIKAHLAIRKAVSRDDGEDRYEPVIRIQMRIIDKHLDFTAYYPAQGVPVVTILGVHKYLNVVSLFKPGTA